MTAHNPTRFVVPTGFTEVAEEIWMSQVKKQADGSYEWHVIDLRYVDLDEYPEVAPHEVAGLFASRWSTNRQREGLWIDGRQVAGTCQFDLKKNPRGRALKAVLA